MRIITLVKKYFGCFFLLLFFLGNNAVYSQCPTVTNTNLSFCDTQSPTVGSSLVATNNGGGIRWYSSATGGIPLTNATALSGGVYYADDSANTCATRPSVTVKIYTKPFSVFGVGTVFCGDHTVADLAPFMTGNQIKWYAASTGGTALPDTTLLGSTTYYASQTNPDTGCETSRRDFNVTIATVPPAPTTSVNPQNFCMTASPTVANLQATGNGILWYATSDAGNSLDPSTPLAGGQSYFAESYISPCSSSSRLEVFVNINTPNNAGSDNSKNICVDQVASTAPFDLFNLLGGADNTGVWTGSILTANGFQGTLDVSTMTVSGSPYVFTYTVSTSVCPVGKATVTINILPLPDANAVFSPASICFGSSSSLDLNGTPNATVTYMINGGSNQTVVLDGLGKASLGMYTTNTTVILLSVATSGTPSCAKLLNVPVALTVTDPTASALFTPATICPGGSSSLDLNGTPNATVTYTINGGSNQTVVLDGLGKVSLGMYTTNTIVILLSVATLGTPSCAKLLNVPVALTVTDPTASALFTPATICSGGSSSLDVNGTPNATVTYVINGGSNQTVVLDGLGKASLGMYTTNTTIALLSVATSDTPSCTKPLNQTLTITVVDPTASVSANPASVCSGGSSTLMFIGTPNATVTYTINSGANQTIVLDASGSATVSNTYSLNTTITLLGIVTAGTPSCTKPLNQNLAITVVDPTASISANPTSVCSGGSSTVTFTGTANATITYTIDGGANQTIVLDASGSATLNNTYSLNATIALLSVATSGTPSCAKLLNQNLTITVVDPTASVSANPVSVCSGGSSILTFTGTPNATVTYTINGGANQTIVLDASGSATLNNTYSLNATIALLSVATSGAPSCTKPLNQTLTITVVDPTASVSANPALVCSGGSSILTFTGTPNATVTYMVNGGANQTIVLNASGSATVSNTYSLNTTIALLSVATSGTPSCAKLLNQNLNITIVDPTASVSANPISVCSGDSSTLTFTGTANATVTYMINGVANQTVVLDASGSAILNDTYSLDTTIALLSVATSGTPSCAKLLNQILTITVVDLTASVSANPASVCSGGSSTLTFTGTANATITYTINGGVNQTVVLDASGSATLNNMYSLDTTISLLSVATSGTPNCTKSLSDSITISTITPPNAGTSPSPVELCVSSPSIDLFPLLGNSAEMGGTWSPALTSGTGVFNPAVDISGTYTYTVKGTVPCSDVSAAVQVTVKPVPYAGTDGNLTICSNANPVDLFNSLEGTPQTGGTWSPALNSGTGIFNPGADAAGVYTYIIKGIAPCVDHSATVTVSIIPGKEAGNDNTLTVCANSVAQDLFLLLGSNAQSGGTWSPAMVSGTGIFNPAVDLQGDYTYAFTGPNSCDNDSAKISVTVNPAADAGLDGSEILCSSDQSVDLFGSLLGTPQLGGVWSPVLASGSGVFNPAIDTAQDYTYTVGGNLCPIATAKVQVTVNVAPSSGGVGQTLNTCVSVTALDLFTGLDGTQGLGTWNDNDAIGALTNNIFDPSKVAAGTYHFTYTVSGMSPCADASSIVAVEVDSQPKAGIFVGIANVCASVGTFDLATLLTGQDSEGVWTDSSLQVVTMPLNLLNFSEGLYNYTYTVTNACNTASVPVQFIILPKPQLQTSNLNTSAVCLGNDATVVLNGVADGTYTVNYDLSGSNGASNQSAVVMTVSGTGSFSIPNASIPNAGVTNVTFTSIMNNTTMCSNVLTNVDLPLNVTPLANIDSSSLTIPTICFGNDVIVNIANAVDLPDGAYQFNYTIPGANPVWGNSGDVTVASGVGQFTVPATVFDNAGNYALTVTGIISPVGCSSANENAVANFVIAPLPDVTGAVISVPQASVNYDNTATITGANNLADGDYTVTYQLTGANVATETVTVTFTSGVATFKIPAADFVNVGDTTIDITQLTSVATTCGIGGAILPPVTFGATVLPTPELISDGNLFCEKNNPAIANLSANIEGTPSVLWYNAPTGGTAYSATDLLVDGSVYYGTLITSDGHESMVRLQVTVDLTFCVAAPDGFSPNNDGINDTFVINNLPSLYPNFKLEIYNRYGNLVYEGNKNTPDWDGTAVVDSLKLGNNVLPNGVYFYVINFNDGVKKPLQGRVYLNR